MAESECEVCRRVVVRRGRKPARFCSRLCKGEWQKTQKPVTREWLVQKYEVEGLGAYEIAKIVKRNAKQVWHWLRGYGIPIRSRSWSNSPDDTKKCDKPYKSFAWMMSEYSLAGRSAADIGKQFGVAPETIRNYLDRLGITRRTAGEVIAIRKQARLIGKQNPMYGVRGAAHPNWKGGHSAVRQAFYESEEWKAARAAVRKRDNDTCRRCGVRRRKGVPMALHHLVTFAVRELRAEPANIIVLCKTCHLYVHSRKNARGEYIVRLHPEAFSRVN